MNNKFRSEVFTLPNILTMLRLALIPVYIPLYMTAVQRIDYWLVGGLVAVSCLTDLLDGRIARKFHRSTTLGTILDPIADKATQLSLLLCLARSCAMLKPVLYLFVLKESLQILAGVLAFGYGRMLNGALAEGKICTCVLFISMICFVVLPGIPRWAGEMLAAADIVCLIYAALSYLLAYTSGWAKLRDLRK